MRIVRIELRNFRCLRDLQIDFDPLTVLVGPNGSGKSSLLRSLEFLFGRYEIDDDDCWGGDRTLAVEITATFADLPEHWAEKMASWLDDRGQLTITRESAPTDGGRSTRFTSTRKQIPEFREIRESAWGAVGRSHYSELRTRDRFTELPSASTKQLALQALDEWERSHGEELEPVPDTTLNIGGGGEFDLEQLMELVTVPAVYDAVSEASEDRAGYLRRLSNLLIRPRLAIDEAVNALVAETSEKYQEIVQGGGEAALREAEDALSRRLGRVAPGTAVRLGWDYRSPALDPPRIRADLVEAGFTTEIGRQGHGVQRAYLFAILQTLVDVRVEEGADEISLLLAIEEPELYQHPVRARFLAGVLAALTSRAGSFPTQVMYSTHSPFFVSLDRVEALRLFRIRQAAPDLPETTVRRVDLRAAAIELWNASGAQGAQFTGETLRPRLRPMIDTPVGEGFFATVVVLVEGEEDRAMLTGAAEARGVNLSELGIAVLPVGGKSSLDRPLIIFRQLGIPTYVIFDGDASYRADPGRSDPASNRLLLRLVAASPEDFPPTQIHDNWAMFEDKLSVTVRSGIGEEHLFDRTLEDVCGGLGFSKDAGAKNGVVLAEAFRRLAVEGKRSPELDQILDKVVTLTG